MAPGPGGGSLGRLQADTAKSQTSEETTRTEGMRNGLAKGEAPANSRAFRRATGLGGVTLPRYEKKAASQGFSCGRLLAVRRRAGP